MAAITTAYVGLNAQPLAPAPVAGAQADVVTVINQDTALTVNLGSSATSLPYQLGPLASVTMTAPVWAAAATGPLNVGVIPGGGGYSPGSLTITGPVTAEITGPVTVEGTVDIGGTVTAEITGTVDADVTGTVDIGNTPSVEISGTPTVEISGTPTVEISGTPTVEISSGTVDATISGGVDISSGSVTVNGNTGSVSGVASASAVQQQSSASPVTLVTMPAAGRIWAVSLAVTVNTNSSYAPDRQQAYASVQTVLAPDPDVTLLVTDVGISGPTQQANQAVSIQLPGLYVYAGTQIELDINAGGVITDATIEASATVVYSTP